MKHLFRLSIAVTLGFIVCISQASFVSAQKKDYGLEKTVQATGNLIPSKIGGADTVPQLIGVIVSSVLGFLGIIFFFLVFYGGLVWMTAQGSEEKIERSKEIISAAVVGLVIVLAAYAFTRFIFDQLAARSGASSGASSNVTTQNGGATPARSAADQDLLCRTYTKDECLAAANRGECFYIDPTAGHPDGQCGGAQ